MFIYTYIHTYIHAKKKTLDYRLEFHWHFSFRNKNVLNHWKFIKTNCCFLYFKHPLFNWYLLWNLSIHTFQIVLFYILYIISVYLCIHMYVCMYVCMYRPYHVCANLFYDFISGRLVSGLRVIIMRIEKFR